MIVYDSSGRKTEYQSVKDYFDRDNDFIEITDEQVPFD